MLLEQLGELMEYEVVEKKVFEGYPLRVEYFLSEKRGNRMIYPASMAAWHLRMHRMSMNFMSMRWMSCWV